MKKVLKFTAIGLVIFAIVANLHSAILSFYGIKSNTVLAANVMGQANSIGGTTGGTTNEDASKKYYHFRHNGCSKNNTISMVITRISSGSASITLNGVVGALTGGGVQTAGSSNTTTQSVTLVTMGTYDDCDLARPVKLGEPINDKCYTGWLFGNGNQETASQCHYPPGTMPSLITYTSTNGPVVNTVINWGSSTSGD